MKKSIILFVLIIAMMLCGCSSPDDSSDDKDNRDQPKLSKTLEKICYDKVEVEVGEPETRNGVTVAKVTAYIPDYASLFLAAAQGEDFEKALEKAVKKGEYETIEYSDYAVVTEKDGETVVEYDEMVRGFCEVELINAVNAVTEDNE